VRAILAVLLLAVFFVATGPAQTAPHRHHQKHHYRHEAHHRAHPHRVAKAPHHLKLTRHVQHARQVRQVRWFGPDTRPRQWCGWFMRQVFHVADRGYNWAPNWARWGHPAPGPRVGAVVVWWYHVGKIVGAPDPKGRWLVTSGNDGNAVRTRYLSVAKAIAFRMP